MGWTNAAKGIIMYQIYGRNYDLTAEYDQIPYNQIKTQSETHWKYRGVKRQQEQLKTIK